MSTSSRGQNLVTASDGLAALEVSEHAKEKEFVLSRVVDIFTSAMQRRWPSRLYYIDLFAGPGKCSIKDSVAEIDGSPMLAAKSKAKFTHYFLADKNKATLGVLKTRIDSLELPEATSVHYYVNDADLAVEQILKDLPPAKHSLGFAVLDPWGWDFAFETLINLSEGRRIDLVINFPIGYIKRNWQNDLQELDEFMNGTAYKEKFQAAMRRESESDTPTRVLLDAYADELHNIGYKFVQDNVSVHNSQNAPLYYLIFASKHERGDDFWRKVTQRNHDGQLKMSL